MSDEHNKNKQNIEQENIINKNWWQIFFIKTKYNVFIFVQKIVPYKLQGLYNKQTINIFLLFIIAILFNFNIYSYAKEAGIIDKNGEGFYYVGDMLYPRSNHSAVQLKDGRIFIAGGETKDYRDDSITEIFDMRTGKSIIGPRMSHPRHKPLLFVLNNGKVLISGECRSSLNKLEIYDPKTNTIEIIGDIDDILSFGRDTAFAINYDDDIVLIACKSFLFKPIYKLNFKKNKLEKYEMKEFPYFDSVKDVLQFDKILYLVDRSSTIIKCDVSSLFEFNPIIREYKPKDYISDKDIKNERSIYLKKQNKILTFTLNLNRSIAFDLDKEIFIYSFQENSKDPIRNMFEINNGNILGFTYKYPDKYDKLLEINPITLDIKEKKYHAPNRVSCILELDEGRILYLGGKQLGITPKFSKKVYIWKNKE
jgi:hypothetical protein